MRLRSLWSLIFVAALATPALASFGGKPETPPTPPSGSTSASSDGEQLTPRQQAEQLYGDAYDDVARGKQDLADHKDKNAEKKFRRALDKGEQAVALDSTYHEAWNLIGFTARKLGDYPKSLAAYSTALRIKPDFAPAREYYGQALLESGDVTGAQQQLAWLDKLGAKDLESQLQASLGAWQTTHPDTTKTAGSK